VSREVEAEIAELRRRLGNRETERRWPGCATRRRRPRPSAPERARDVALASMECLRLRREIERLESQR